MKLCSLKSFASVFAALGCFALLAQEKLYTGESQWVRDFRNADMTPFLYNTAARVMFDDKNLYVEFDFKDDLIRKPATPPQIKTKKWPMCESAEIFIDSGNTGTKYIQFAYGIDGSLYDSRFSDKLKEWRAKWTVSNKKLENGHWNFVVTIPFADLGVKKPNIGDVWGVNVCRNAWINTKKSFGGSYAHVGNAFHNPSKFATLLFGEPEEFAHARTQKIAYLLGKLKKQLAKENLINEFSGRLQAMEKECSEDDLVAIQDELIVIHSLKNIQK